ncbi:membrane associated rhomboid family serine protease [Chitinophaga skermanii]|uniref:Membrane associated rhomboid family serine protease n=1 Tax=Chitinophaga skermanii TaxID=331697 RepID=A0A327QRU9_9BACT|nr:rhomboid family intramembrane serine protease [Chitinophaga skermanii]RAJ07001.1 membrane associated rhomboid family serine protease [Chitinophaga skermanii]
MYALTDTPISFIIIIITCLVSFNAWSRPEMQDKFMFWPYEIKRRKEIWRMFTVGLVHNDFQHLLWNMLTLFFFRGLENVLGPVYFSLLYVSSLAISGIPDLLKYKDDYHYSAVGASGAVNSIVFATVLLAPWAMVWGIIPFILYAVLYLIYSVYMTRRMSNIGHMAHVAGAVYGLIFMVIWNPDVVPYFINTVLMKFN